jgi:predicted alpha-1,2-mannosidase
MQGVRHRIVLPPRSIAAAAAMKTMRTLPKRIASHPIRPRASVLIILGVMGAAGAAQAADPVAWVDPHIGTGSGPVGYGRTMPYVVPPFGMTSWTPQTRQNRTGGTSYKYDDKTITGFMGTHQAAMWMGDYGYVTLMPETGALKVTPEARALPFSHADETTRPDYYAVRMRAGDDSAIRAEMTGAAHSGYLRFTFPAGVAPRIVVEASRPRHAGFVHVDPAAREITGYNPDRMDADLGPKALPNFRGYFVIQFRRAFASSGTFQPDKSTDSATGAYALFPAAGPRIVEVRVGTSFISIAQARRNLETEIPGWDFDRTRATLRAAWNRALRKIDISGATDAQRRIFYTALYHALLYPRGITEQGRYYSAFDDRVHAGRAYTDYSIWDMFRAEYSLLTLTVPDRAGQMVQALLQDYQEGGWMPKWPNPSYTNIMIGTHADSLVSEALAKGLGGFDHDLAWRALYKDGMVPPDGDLHERWADREPHTPYEARAGLTYLKKLGYIPVDKTAEAASRTVEGSYDDWAIAQAARLLGKPKATVAYFLNRSLAYRHLYNPKTSLLQGRNADGSWADPRAGWTEGSAWPYTFAPLHDIAGLIGLMGGAEAFDARLDAYFDGGHNWHSNEPSHHMGYLYDFGGQPWKTQAKVREIAKWEYADAPSGLDGDDDCGQMSAWYIFTALGFYPVNPASADYMIGSPLFPRAVLHLAGGKSFVVNAAHASESNIYIQSARLNGKPLTVPVISYRDIVAGGTLEFVMGPKPSTWGAAWRAKPVAGAEAAATR